MNNIKLYGVCGNPVLHSKSPDVFKYLFLKNRLNAAYLRLAVDNIEEISFLIKHLNISGLNITAPFKKEIFQIIDDISPDALEIDAVNTVLCADVIQGFNTDYKAVLQIIRNNNIDLTDKQILIVGAGNAAKSALFALKKHNLKIINRTNEKAKALASKFNIAYAAWKDLQAETDRADIIISTINAREQLYSLDKSNAVIIDAIYNNSPLKKAALQSGNKYIPGEEWLIYQALPAYELFTGQTAGAEDIFSIASSKNPVLRGVAAGRGVYAGDMNISQDLFTRMAIPETSPKPKNMILSGFMGAGKSSLAEYISRNYGYELIDTDVVIEKEAGMKIEEIFRIHGEAYFREIETGILEDINKNVQKMSGKYIFSIGGGIPANPDNREILNKLGYNFWIVSDMNDLMERIQDSVRPLIKQKSAKEIKKLYKSRIDDYALCSDAVIINNVINRTAEKIINEINAIE